MSAVDLGDVTGLVAAQHGVKQMLLGICASGAA